MYTEAADLDDIGPWVMTLAFVRDGKFTTVL